MHMILVFFLALGALIFYLLCGVILFSDALRDLDNEENKNCNICDGCFGATNDDCKECPRKEIKNEY